MFRRLFLSLSLLSTLGIISCKQTQTVAVEDDFALGADISWNSELSSRGNKFYDFEGKEFECTALMKHLGLNAIRLRVWVNPEDHGQPNWCNKEDLLVQAKLVKEQGMDLMVDFHYSDWWADPQRQNIPHSWSGHSYEQMRKDLHAHTVEVLTLLKDNGIEPKWVQAGNETRNGMLFSAECGPQGWVITDENGKINITESMGHLIRPGSSEESIQNGIYIDQSENYAGFLDEAYGAIKEVFPNTIVIVHLDNGFDQGLYDWNIGILKRYGTRFDMIGMSLYPYWAIDGGFETDADETITHCMQNIKHVADAFGCDVMIVETGFEVDEAHPEVMAEGRRLLNRVIKESKTMTEGHCKGIFYWEPECRPSQHYKLGAFYENGSPTEIMKAFTD